MRLMDLHLLIENYMLEHRIVPIIIGIKKDRRPKLNNLGQVVIKLYDNSLCEELSYVIVLYCLLIKRGDQLLYICYSRNVNKSFFQINSWIVSTKIVLCPLRVVNQILINDKG